ncbi:MAG: ImmA/IrrE family metallo-endopeptidase [Clostridia bacterium]
MTRLFEIATENSICFEYIGLPRNESVSIHTPERDYVALDYSLIESGAEERVHGAHEIGHCITGAFYYGYSPLECRAKQEAKATRWAIEQLVSLTALRTALQRGFAELWELSEYFCVTDEFMAAAIDYWTITKGENLNCC